VQQLKEDEQFDHLRTTIAASVGLQSSFVTELGIVANLDNLDKDRGPETGIYW
jgi:hypothetical protein